MQYNNKDDTLKKNTETQNIGNSSQYKTILNTDANETKIEFQNNDFETDNLNFETKDNFYEQKDPKEDTNENCTSLGLDIIFYTDEGQV
ncbi:hypothetical protein, partial [Borreliella garinii]|uniref:hypothetical protein n=1 Tax=Borreliella garinii TaxID=29519 RepID=UPI001AEE0D27